MVLQAAVMRTARILAWVIGAIFVVAIWILIGGCSSDYMRSSPVCSDCVWSSRGDTLGYTSKTWSGGRWVAVVKMSDHWWMKQ